MDNFGVLLKTLRTLAGLTQKDFAHKLNTTFTSVSNWETNKRYPDIMTLRNIAQVLNVSYDMLLNPTESLNKLSSSQEVFSSDSISMKEASPHIQKNSYQKHIKLLLICIIFLMLFAIGFLLITNMPTKQETKYIFMEAHTNVPTEVGTGSAYELVFCIDDKVSPHLLLNHSDSLADAWKNDVFNDCDEGVFIVSYYLSKNEINDWDKAYFQAFTLNNPPK